MEFLKRIKDLAPQYEASLEHLITRFTLVQGGRAGTANEATAWEQGKYFNTKYEAYMYATIIGLKADYKLKLTEGSKREKFIEIKSWQPSDLADYIIMGVLAKAHINFIELEKKDEKDVENEIKNVRRLLEEYANGGFDKIRAKLEKDPGYFENNENCLIDFLDQANH
ncbi:MAG: hypothetical protein ACK5OS_05470 [Chryseotalea sp.]|jgi:hypothetical protein